MFIYRLVITVFLCRDTYTDPTYVFNEFVIIGGKVKRHIVTSRFTFCHCFSFRQLCYKWGYRFVTTERDCFVLISDVPLQRVQDGIDLIRSEDEMIRGHASGWFVDQGELPF